MELSSRALGTTASRPERSLAADPVVRLRDCKASILGTMNGWCGARANGPLKHAQRFRQPDSSPTLALTCPVVASRRSRSLRGTAATRARSGHAERSSARRPRLSKGRWSARSRAATGEEPLRKVAPNGLAEGAPELTPSSSVPAGCGRPQIRRTGATSRTCSCVCQLMPVIDMLSLRPGLGAGAEPSGHALVIDQLTSYTELAPHPVLESVPGCVVVVR